MGLIYPTTGTRRTRSVMCPIILSRRER
ncbi:uncharacterized protein G2W53_044956 [Senna tora]|uniref:Uncharacterized protein n=1 Tax=Senna tora TaxID=362788 RepID=A0A834SC76_9FABA|nr:uncharacterized protein G2W53_044956 [Senna tora]